MNDKPLIPTALKVVAILFIATGIFAVIDIVLSLLQGRLSINLGLLGLFIGPGLRRLSSGWRTVALVYLVIGVVLGGFAAVLFLTSSGPINFNFFGLPAGYAPKELAIVTLVVLFGLMLWQLYVLTREDVRRLFEAERVA